MTPRPFAPPLFAPAPVDALAVENDAPSPEPASFPIENPAAGAHIAALRLRLAEFKDEADRTILQELQAFKAEADEAASTATLADGFAIADDAMEARGAAAMLQIHSKLKRLEEMRTSVTKPTLAFKADVDALFETPKAEYGRAKTTLGNKLAAYRAGVERAKAAALAAAQATAKTAEQQRAIIVASTTEAPKPQGTRTIITYVVEVLDEQATVRARPDLCAPIASRVTDAAEAAAKRGAPFEVPGLKITAVPRVVPTGR